MQTQITESAFSLLSYYVSNEEDKTPIVYRIDKEKDLLNVLGLGSYISPVLSLIEYKGTIPKKFEVSIFNKVYLCVEDVKKWNKVLREKEWVSVLELAPELYKKKLIQYKSIFEDEYALDYFWDTWKMFPKKLEAELIILLIKYGVTKDKITLEDLTIKCPKERNLFLDICKNLGKLDKSRLLFELSETSLYQLFIGTENRPPYIYYYLVGTKKKEGQNPELYEAIEVLREAVVYNYIPIQTGVVILNNWISNLEKKKVNYKKLIFNIRSEELVNLESLLKGF